MMAHLVVGKFVPGEVQSIFEVGLVNAGLTIGSNLEIVNKTLWMVLVYQAWPQYHFDLILL